VLQVPALSIPGRPTLRLQALCAWAPRAGLIPIGPATFIPLDAQKDSTRRLISRNFLIPSRSILRFTSRCARTTRRNGSNAWRPIRALCSPPNSGKRFTHDVRSITSGSAAEDERAVRAGFDVLRAANKLGAVLLQFPFSFHRTAETVAYLTAVLKRFADYPLVVEVRHGSWNAPETLELLRTSGVSFCNIDQPIIGRSLGRSAQTTSAVGYVRLHGRRNDTWFSDDATIPAHERYNYLYTTEELAPWVTRVHKITERAGETFVITNNHFQGKAVVNALAAHQHLEGIESESA